MSPAQISPADLHRAKALPLMLALDDHDFPDRERALAKWLVRLTYLQGIDSLVLGSRTDLAELAGIGKKHFTPILRELVRKKVLLVHDGTDVCRVLTDVRNWHAPSLCDGGHDHALRLAQGLVRMHYDAVHQVDMAAVEASFQRPPTLDDGFALVSQEEGSQVHWQFDLRPPGPGAAGGRVHEDPPGVIQDAAAAGPLPWTQEWVREQARRSLESVGVPVDAAVPETGTGHDLRTDPSLVPVPETGTGSGQEPAVGMPESPKRGPSLKNMVAESLKRGPGVPETGTESPKRGPSGPETARRVPETGTPSRARPSDDHLPSGHLPTPVQRTSSSDQNQGDEGRKDERRGAERWQMVATSDDLFADLRRTLGEHLAGFSVDWRRAIHITRPCVYEALASWKLNRAAIRKHPGGYLRACFLDECRKRRVELPPDLFPNRKERVR